MSYCMSLYGCELSGVRMMWCLPHRTLCSWFPLLSYYLYHWLTSVVDCRWISTGFWKDSYTIGAYAKFEDVYSPLSQKYKNSIINGNNINNRTDRWKQTYTINTNSNKLNIITSANLTYAAAVESSSPLLPELLWWKSPLKFEHSDTNSQDLFSTEEHINKAYCNPTL